MKMFLILYVGLNHIGEVSGPVSDPALCRYQANALQQTMIATILDPRTPEFSRKDMKRWVFACEWRRFRPKLGPQHQN